MNTPRSSGGWFCATVVFLVTLLCLTTQGAAAAGTLGCGGSGGGLPPTAMSIISGGVTRTYRLQVPSKFDGTTPLPLVLSFHGYGQNAAYQERYSGLGELAERRGFILVHPQGVGKPPSWNAGGAFGALVPERSDVGFVRDLIDDLSTRYCIDPMRILATGFSNGGGFVDRLGCELSDRITVIAPVSGGFISRNDSCRPGSHVAVVAVHGDADQVTPYEGDSVGLFEPVQSWLAQWARRDRCDASPSSKLAATGQVIRVVYGHCARAADVRLYRVLDRGHEWFADADRWIWSFVSKVWRERTAMSAARFVLPPSHLAPAKSSYTVAAAAQAPNCPDGLRDGFRFEGVPSQLVVARWANFAVVSNSDSSIPRSAVVSFELSVAPGDYTQPITFAYTVRPNDALRKELPLLLGPGDGSAQIQATWTYQLGSVQCKQSISTTVIPVASSEPTTAVSVRSNRVEFRERFPGSCADTASGPLRVRVRSGEGLPHSIVIVDQCARWDLSDVRGSHWKLVVGGDDGAARLPAGSTFTDNRVALFVPQLHRAGRKEFAYRVSLAGHQVRAGRFTVVTLQRRGKLTHRIANFQ